MRVSDRDTLYVCVDLEASGPVPGLYNMVSIGGVCVRYEDGKHVRGDEFYFELKPISEGFDDHAMSIHGISRAHLEEHGRDAREVLAEITDWVNARRKPNEKVLFVGHNAPFDWMYTAWYFAWAGYPNPFGYNALDTKALFMGRFGLPWRECNKETLTSLFPTLTAPRPEDVHNALCDARFQADILIALLDYSGTDEALS